MNVRDDDPPGTRRDSQRAPLIPSHEEQVYTADLGLPLSKALDKRTKAWVKLPMVGISLLPVEQCMPVDRTDRHRNEGQLAFVVAGCYPTAAAAGPVRFPARSSYARRRSQPAFDSSIASNLCRGRTAHTTSRTTSLG
jgi:hypothetical protein